jgi:hypothetical protein
MVSEILRQLIENELTKALGITNPVYIVAICLVALIVCHFVARHFNQTMSIKTKTIELSIGKGGFLIKCGEFEFSWKSD